MLKTVFQHSGGYKIRYFIKFALEGNFAWDSNRRWKRDRFQTPTIGGRRISWKLLVRNEMWLKFHHPGVQTTDRNVANNKPSRKKSLASSSSWIIFLPQRVDILNSICGIGGINNNIPSSGMTLNPVRLPGMISPIHTKDHPLNGEWHNRIITVPSHPRKEK